jgi:hypothetical protein
MEYAEAAAKAVKITMNCEEKNIEIFLWIIFDIFDDLL